MSDILLKDTGWIRKCGFDNIVEWYRRVGFITMNCYRTQGGPHHRWSAHVNAGPFGVLQKEFRSQGGPRRFCETILKRILWIMDDLEKTSR